METDRINTTDKRIARAASRPRALTINWVLGSIPKVLGSLPKVLGSFP